MPGESISKEGKENKMRTHPRMLADVVKALRDTSYPPTGDNPDGVCGMHSFINDIMDIVLNSANEATAYRDLCRYLLHREEKQNE